MSKEKEWGTIVRKAFSTGRGGRLVSEKRVNCQRTAKRIICHGFTNGCKFERDTGRCCDARVHFPQYRYEIDLASFILDDGEE